MQKIDIQPKQVKHWHLKDNCKVLKNKAPEAEGMDLQVLPVSSEKHTWYSPI